MQAHGWCQHSREHWRDVCCWVQCCVVRSFSTAHHQPMSALCGCMTRRCIEAGTRAGVCPLRQNTQQAVPGAPAGALEDVGGDVSGDIDRPRTDGGDVDVWESGDVVGAASCLTGWSHSMGIGSSLAAAGRQASRQAGHTAAQEEGATDTWEPWRGGANGRQNLTLYRAQCGSGLRSAAAGCARHSTCLLWRALQPAPAHAPSRHATTRTTTTARRTILCVCCGRAVGGMGWVKVNSLLRPWGTGL